MKYDRLPVSANRWLVDRLMALNQRLDDWRIGWHLRQTERQLRARDVSAWPPAMQAKREHHLDQLHDYWVQGIFPRNRAYPGQFVPCFIDRERRVCAVAHLLVADGQAWLADDIAASANEAYLEAMDVPGLVSWVAGSGLNQAELAQIQPTYSCPEACVQAAQAMLAQQVTFMTRILLVGTVLGLGATVTNIVTILRKWWSMLWLGSALGIAVGAGMVYIGLTFSLGEVWHQVTGSIPCQGAGVVDACNPSSPFELSQALDRLTNNTFLIGVLIFLASCLGLGKGIRQETFALPSLLLTLVGTVVAALPTLFMLTLAIARPLHVDVPFADLDLFRLAIFIALVMGSVGFIIWRWGQSPKPTERPHG